MKKKDNKYNPNKVRDRDMKKLSNMISNNTKYLSVGHGLPKNLRDSD